MRKSAYIDVEGINRKSLLNASNQQLDVALQTRCNCGDCFVCYVRERAVAYDANRYQFPAYLVPSMATLTGTHQKSRSSWWWIKFIEEKGKWDIKKNDKT